MKNSLLIILLSLLLTNCSGWNQEEKDMFLETCKDVGGLDCDCALKKYIEKFPSFDDFTSEGKKDAKIAEEVANTCSSGWTANDKAMFNETCQMADAFNCDCALKMYMQKFPTFKDFTAHSSKDSSFAHEVARTCKNP